MTEKQAREALVRAWGAHIAGDLTEPRSGKVVSARHDGRSILIWMRDPNWFEGVFIDDWEERHSLVIWAAYRSGEYYVTYNRFCINDIQCRGEQKKRFKELLEQCEVIPFN